MFVSSPFPQCSEDDSLKYSSYTEVDMMARRLAKKMTDLNVTREEYMLMKAMLLVNPGAQYVGVFKIVVPKW